MGISTINSTISSTPSSVNTGTPLHLLTPSYLLHNLAFLVLAGGLGLPLDVLLAGQGLRWLLGCLAAAEPLLLIGLLVWAGHKVTVRKLPLVDRQYWINRMGNLRVVINQQN